MTGFPNFARSAYGLVEDPTFSAAKAGSRPVMNTAEHMIFAKPDVWCSNVSPGGGTYGVSSSNDFARAIRASLAGSDSCEAAVLTAMATTTGTSESLIMTISCDGIHQEAVVQRLHNLPKCRKGKKQHPLLGRCPQWCAFPDEHTIAAGVRAFSGNANTSGRISWIVDRFLRRLRLRHRNFGAENRGS